MRTRGLTWDHPRGYNALAAAAATSADCELDWDKQPLEGFEAHPIADLCARYDLVVLDHPHVGEAVAAGCLQPLEAHFGADEIAALGAESIRSEEHTSELQSLMRISYAVFCLTKKKRTKT